MWSSSSFRISSEVLIALYINISPLILLTSIYWLSHLLYSGANNKLLICHLLIILISCCIIKLINLGMIKRYFFLIYDVLIVVLFAYIIKYNLVFAMMMEGNSVILSKKLRILFLQKWQIIALRALISAPTFLIIYLFL